MLGCSPTQERHTGVELSKFIEKTTDFWNLQDKVLISLDFANSNVYSQIAGVVSDTASNMTCMMGYLPELSWVGCTNHIIQLVVNVRINHGFPF